MVNVMVYVTVNVMVYVMVYVTVNVTVYVTVNVMVYVTVNVTVYVTVNVVVYVTNCFISSRPRTSPLTPFTHSLGHYWIILSMDYSHSQISSLLFYKLV